MQIHTVTNWKSLHFDFFFIIQINICDALRENEVFSVYASFLKTRSILVIQSDVGP